MSGTQSATLTPWPGLPEDPAAQREWAKRWQKDLPKGGLNEEQRALVVNWAIANIELFRSSSQLLWEGEMRIFINIATQRDHRTPSKWLGVKGQWVKEWQELRAEEKTKTGTIPRDGDYAEAMDQWLVFIQEKIDKERVSKEARTKKDSAAEYRERQKKLFEENSSLRRKDRRSLSSSSLSEREISWSRTPEPGEITINENEEMEKNDLDEEALFDDADATQSPGQHPPRRSTTASIPPRRTNHSQSRSQSRGRSRTPIHRSTSKEGPSAAKSIDRMADIMTDLVRSLLTPTPSQVSELKEELSTIQKNQEETNEKIDRLMSVLLTPRQP